MYKEFEVIKLLVRTNEPLAAIGLKVLFQGCLDISVQSVVANPSQLVRQISSQEPDVLLLGADAGVDVPLITHVLSQSPGAKVVLWVYEITPEQAYQAIECGVRGILRKSVPPALIVECVRKVHQGELWIEKTLTDVFLSGSTIRISRRENELISLIGRGLKNKEIAQVLCIAEGTVKVYLSRLFNKLNVKDRLELALFGLRNGHSSGELPRASMGRRLLLRDSNRMPSSPRETLNGGPGCPKPMLRFNSFLGGSTAYNSGRNLSEEVS